MLEEAKATVKEHVDAREYADYKLLACDLEMTTEGTLVVPTNGMRHEFALSDHAASRLMRDMGVHVDYGKKIPSDLLAENMNYWFSHPEVGLKELMVRTERLKGFDELLPQVRAVASHQYAPISNLLFLEQLERVMEYWTEDIDREALGLEVDRFDYDGNDLHMTLKMPGLATELVEGDELVGGAYISNSEIGKSAMRLTPLVLRMICTNGLMGWGTGDDAGFYRSHRGSVSAHDLYFGMLVGMAKVQSGMESATHLMSKAHSIKLEDPIAELETIVDQDHRLSKKFLERATEVYQGDEFADGSLYSVINALTWAAHDREGEDRAEIETMAGRLLATRVRAA